MSPTDRDTIFDLKDMHLIGFQCPKCTTEIIFDVARENTGIPMKCPTCPEEFGELTMNDVLGTYRRVYQGASSVPSRKYVHIVARLLRRSNPRWRSRRTAAHGYWKFAHTDQFSRPVPSRFETFRDEWLVA